MGLPCCFMTPEMLGPFQVHYSSSPSLPFQGIRYCGPVLSGLDKAATDKFYLLEGTTLILPVAFCFGSGQTAFLELPQWMAHQSPKPASLVSLLPAEKAEALPSVPSISLKWSSPLGGPFQRHFPFEQVLPELLNPKRPLCHGCVLPVSWRGLQFLLKVECESVAEGQLFTFDLGEGDLHLPVDLSHGDLNQGDHLPTAETISMPSSLAPKEIDFFRLQMKLATATNENGNANIFLLSRVPFNEQERVLASLTVRKRVDLLALIPEEPFSLSEDVSVSEAETGEYFGLAAVDWLGEAVLEAVLRHHRGGNLVFISTGTVEPLVRLAARFNFTLWTQELSSADRQDQSEQLLVRAGWTPAAAQARLKQSLHSHSQQPFKSLVTPKTSFFGYESLKQELTRFFLDPLLKRESFLALGLSCTPPGLLLHGPSGGGKSALLHSILSSSAIRAHYTVLHVPSGSCLLSRYLGGTEANIRALFTEARAHRPCIIFIDQIASLGRKRSSSEPDASGGGKQRYLSTLLNELDGIGGSEGVTVVATCHEPAELDEALLRPGRLERHIGLPLPSREDRLALLEGLFNQTGIEDEEPWMEGMTASQIICTYKRRINMSMI